MLYGEFLKSSKIRIFVKFVYLMTVHACSWRLWMLRYVRIFLIRQGIRYESIIWVILGQYGYSQNASILIAIVSSIAR